MKSFRDKVAIVTGGASGIGRSLCEELSRQDALVVVADLNDERTQEVVADITATDGRARAARVDVSHEENVQELIDETAARHGRIDYVFNNAGIGLFGEVRDMEIEHWHRVINVNLWGVIHGTAAAYKVMVRQGFGHIINTASVVGLVPTPMQTAYVATKHAIVALSLALRQEADDLGVRVSVACPGFIETDIFDSLTLLKIRREDFVAQMPYRMMDVTKAARVILRGVRRNRKIITCPYYVRPTWWLHRLHPSLLGWVGRRMVNRFRELRDEH
jgi:NAD(P)-dependent dehydrogenase (short-subunit alcohol dehydrogenase family)